jgi:general secretion pathway protein G
MNTKKGPPAMLEKISGVITARIHDDTDRHNEEGFTLIELLIVVIVLGILAAVTVFGLSGASSQSAAAACKSDARTVEVAIDAYHANDSLGNWPTVGGGWTSLTAPAGGPGGADPGQPANVAPYLRSQPANTSHYGLAIQQEANGTYGVFVTPTAAGSTPGFFDSAPNPNPCDGVK